MRAILKAQDVAKSPVDLKNFALLWGILLEFLFYQVRNLLNWQLIPLIDQYRQGYRMMSDAISLIGRAWGITTGDIQAAIGKTRDEATENLGGY
jgi:hypothetical protein